MAITSVLVFFLLPACASAVITGKAPRPSGGGFVQNGDGSWSLWGEGGTKPLRTYTPLEHSQFERVAKGIDVQSGSTGQSASDIAGITKSDKELITKTREALRPGEVWTKPEEERVGEAVARDMEAEKTIPALVDEAGTLGVADVVASGAGAFVAGVAIGNGIDDLLGIPDVGTLLEQHVAEGCRVGFGCDEELVKAIFGLKIHYHGTAKKCSELESAVEGIGQPLLSGKCLQVIKTLVRKTFIHKENGETEEYGETLEGSYFTAGGSFGGTWQTDINHCPFQGSAYVCWSNPSPFPFAGGVELVLIEPLFNFRRLGFPGNHPVQEEGLSSGPSSATIAPPTPLTTPIPPKGPEVDPVPASELIAHEGEKGPLPGIPETPEEEKEEKARPVPSPLWPELPEPLPNEIGTHYKSRVESDGYEHVELEDLPEGKPDPSHGPEEVTSIDPAPKNKYDASTKVRIKENPKTAPPAETGKIPAINIGGIDEPELKPPHLNVLCENFPFGVPCWLVEELQSWSAVGEAPELGIEEITIKGHKIKAGKVDLARLEPIMEKVRPFMIVFGTVGLVLLFYGFATGGNPGSGSGSSGGGSGSDDSEEGE